MSGEFKPLCSFMLYVSLIPGFKNILPYIYMFYYCHIRFLCFYNYTLYCGYKFLYYKEAIHAP